MTITIKSRTDAVLFTSENAADLKSAVIEGVSRGADLRDADLPDADLQDANLQDANLRGVYLRGANLRGADLRAYLRDADLQDADLRGADLRGADLQGADLQAADLRGAALRSADLQGANLRGAYLRGAGMRDADLRDADLRGTDLRDAKNAELVIAQTRILPDEGEIVGWKKASGNTIVKLLIPANAGRSHASGRKCRAERAVVLAVFDEKGTAVDWAVSRWDSAFPYEVGATVEPTEPFDTDMWNECSSGIHFYITRIEAENHV